MTKILICPNCGNTAMSWVKKLFGLTLKCVSCGETLRHDVLWSLLTVIGFTSLAYFFSNYFFGPLVVVPILVLASLVIIFTPLKHKGRSE